MILSEQHEKVLPAFIKARSLITGAVKKDRRNDHLKTSYATLGSVMGTIDPAMREAGITMIQNATFDGNGVNVITIIMENESFQTMTFNTFVPVTKMDGQGFGSGMTYGRRYACLGIFGLVPADDDGEGTKKTAQDVKRAMSAAETVEDLELINNAAKNHFRGDSTSLNVIASHYDSIKAKLNIGDAKSFNAFPDKSNASKSEPVEANPNKAPVDNNQSPDADF